MGVDQTITVRAAADAGSHTEGDCGTLAKRTQKKPRRPQDAGLPRRGTPAKNVDDTMGMLAPPA
jgi:hypothetical protein